MDVHSTKNVSIGIDPYPNDNQDIRTAKARRKQCNWQHSQRLEQLATQLARCIEMMKNLTINL
jgi:hypothetical protein